MRSFRNDYSEGAHPRIIEALTATNLDQTPGYTFDEHCDHARELIARQIGRPDAHVEFVIGGTQANLLVIAAALRPHEAVIAADTGHINVHETGAVEASGHKILTTPGDNGLLTVEAVERVWEANTSCHMVKPRMIYISDSTEIGTIYDRATLHALREFADAHDMLIYLDGARLSVALQSEANDVTLEDIASTCDAFTFGGTKNGALFGECVVFLNPALATDFTYIMKQRGAMLAKGRLLGVQYETLFADDLYWELGRHADEQAMALKAGLEELGFELYVDSPTNQQFIVASEPFATELMTISQGEVFANLDDGRVAVRLVTSWATPPEAVDELLAWLKTRH